MTELRILFAIIPSMFGLVALSLCYIAVLDQRRMAARWGALGFALAAAGVTLDSIRPPGHFWMLLYLHLFVVFCVLTCLWSRHRTPLPAGMALLLTATAAGCGLVLLLDGSLQWRTLVFHSGVGLALGVAMKPIWLWAKQGGVERLVAYSLTAVFLSYLLRIFILLGRPLSPALSARPSFFSVEVNVLFHFLMAVGGTLMGMAMIVALGHDLLRQQARRSCTDALTRLGNRHALAETIYDDDRGTWRCGGVISLDLDRFKAVNDAHGHAAGDALLMATADALRASLGAAGRLCRIGGEEFVLLVDQSLNDQLSRLAEEARVAIASIELALSNTHVRPTASFGICRRLPGEPIDALLREADVALYRAKAEGRNRVVSAR